MIDQNFSLRFQDGGTFDPNGFLLRKRMAESIQMAKRDLEERENAAAAATSVASAVKQAGAGAKLNDEEQQADDITRFAVADEYWKEYLNDVARRKALAALVRTLLSNCPYVQSVRPDFSKSIKQNLE